MSCFDNGLNPRLASPDPGMGEGIRIIQRLVLPVVMGKNEDVWDLDLPCIFGIMTRKERRKGREE